MKLRTTMEKTVKCHPRRDFARDDWLSLNGVWEFAIDECDVGERDEWFLNVKRFDRKIIVPFPIQSRMAWGEKGGNKPTEYASELKDYYGVVWYKRKISVPKAWRGKRVILKFGAVDWYTRVWVNEKFVGEHYGGYLPFEFDITDYISYEKENFIVVRVFDPQDTSSIPVGKQQNWYTRTTGIWQTVYLEAREEFFIKNIKITPDVDAGKVKFKIHTGGNNHSCKKYQLVIEIPAADVIEVIESSEEEIIKEIVIRKPRLWSPERPYLYDTTVRLKFGIDREDVVKTYFGMRKVSTCFLPGKDYKYIYLNNKPIYIRGVLDQGFNPDGVYTYPSEEYIKRDLELAKKLGFNLVRTHIKINDPLYYYWADKIGIMVMYDLPNFWEGGYYSENARNEWKSNLIGAIDRDYNHPSIIIWCLFNESWGLGLFNYKHDAEKQSWVKEMYDLAKTLDNTRIIDDMSPLFDPPYGHHVETELNDWHFYNKDYNSVSEHLFWVNENTYKGSQWNYVVGKLQDDAPLMNSEYGGISACDGDKDVSYYFKWITNEIRKYPKICGYVYTQLTDVEWECNGMVRYDRSEKYFGYEPQIINSADFIVIHAPPYIRTNELFISFPIYFAYFSGKEMIKPVLRWKFEGNDIEGDEVELSGGVEDITVKEWDVVKIANFSIKLPERTRRGRVYFEVAAAAEVVAKNFIDIIVEKDYTVANYLELKIGGFVDTCWDGDFRCFGEDVSKGWKFLKMECAGNANEKTEPFFEAAMLPQEATLDFDDSQWETVSLPHVLHVDAQQNEYLWYRRKIYIERLETMYYLDLPPVYGIAHVYVNDEYIGSSEDARYYDITGKIRVGENVIAICVKSKGDAAVGINGIITLVDTEHTYAVMGEKSGYVVYKATVPENAKCLVFEASSNEPGEAQTDAYTTPTELNVIINGELVTTINIPDSPCDSTGIFSYASNFRGGKYGYLYKIDISRYAGQEVEIKFEVPKNSNNKNGLILYGKRAGRYGIGIIVK